MSKHIITLAILLVLLQLSNFLQGQNSDSSPAHAWFSNEAQKTFDTIEKLQAEIRKTQKSSIALKEEFASLESVGFQNVQHKVKLQNEISQLNEKVKSLEQSISTLESSFSEFEEAFNGLSDEVLESLTPTDLNVLSRLKSESSSINNNWENSQDVIMPHLANLQGISIAEATNLLGFPEVPFIESIADKIDKPVRTKAKVVEQIDGDYKEYTIKPTRKLKEMFFAESGFSILKTHESLFRIAPTFNWQLTDRIAFGVGGIYQNRISIEGNESIASSWRGRMVGQYRIVNWLSLRAEADSGNSDEGTAASVGGRLNMPFNTEGVNIPFNITFMRRVSNYQTPHYLTSPWQMRLGLRL